MNNYCTNCGKRLENNELKCTNCNTPIIDLAQEYKHQSPEQKVNKRKTLITILIIVLCIIEYYVIKTIVKNIKVKNLQTKYVEPYLKQNYNNERFSIEYESSGKCIISGNCAFDPVMGCDGGACEQYEYLDESECKSYYFTVNNQNEQFTVTVVNEKKQYRVVEGVNIYGTDAKEKEIEDDYSNKETITTEQNMDNDEISNTSIIESFPYESDYYNFDSDSKEIYLNNRNMLLSFFTGLLYNKSKLYISGSIKNPEYLSGKVNMITKYYDEYYSEIGKCEEDIDLLGEGYSAISFSCHISEEDLLNNQFSDVKYYKINISSIKIDDELEEAGEENE